MRGLSASAHARPMLRPVSTTAPFPSQVTFHFKTCEKMDSFGAVVNSENLKNSEVASGKVAKWQRRR